MNVDLEACEEDQDTLKGMFKQLKSLQYVMVVDFDFQELEDLMESTNNRKAYSTYLIWNGHRY